MSMDSRMGSNPAGAPSMANLSTGLRSLQFLNRLYEGPEITQSGNSSNRVAAHEP